MSIQIQLRRGTALQHTTFTGATAELSVDTTNYTLRLHDGSTAGGLEILRKDLANLANGAILNTKLANSSITINGQTVSLGGSTTITASATNALTIGTGLSGTSYNGSSAVTIALSNTGVTAGSYGSATEIPVLTINAQGQVTAATVASVASSLNIAGDTGTDSVSMLTDTLTVSGGTGLSSVVTNNNVTINLDNTTVTPGTYGTASAVPVITVDAQGRITSASTTAVAGVSGVSFDSATGVLTISTSAGTSYTPDLGIGTGDSPTFAALTTTGNLTVGGDLIVNGTTTTVNSTTITVDDKNIELGSVATPTNITADGGGITLKGATDKTLTWVNSTGAWTSSEDFNLLTGKVYQINGTTVLSSTQVLGKSLPTGDVVGSSDTQTLSNKILSAVTLSGTTTYSASGSNAIINYNTGSTPTTFDVRVVASGGDGTQGNGDYNIISGTLTHNLVPIVTTSGTQSLTNKTLVSPNITGVSPTITLAGDLTGSVTLTNLGNATLTATIAANSVALGTDTTGNYASEVLAGSGINVSGTAGEGTSFTISHADTSSASNLVATSRTYVTGLTFDTFGHVTGYTTGSENVSNTTYSISAETATGGANIRISGSDSSVDDVKLAAGSNINITRTDANTITIESTASSSKFLVYKRGDVAPSSATPIVISSGQLTVYGRTQNIGVLV